MPESPPEGEDADGRNESAQAVELGVDQAGREQRIEAARANRLGRRPEA